MFSPLLEPLLLPEELWDSDSEPLWDELRDSLSLWLADPDSERELDWLPDSLLDCDPLFELEFERLVLPEFD